MSEGGLTSRPRWLFLGCVKVKGHGSPPKKTGVQKCFILFRRKFQSCISRKLQVTKCLDLFIMFFFLIFLCFWFSTISVHREPSKLFNRIDFLQSENFQFSRLFTCTCTSMLQSSINECTLIQTDHTNCISFCFGGSMVWLQWASWPSRP